LRDIFGILSDAMLLRWKGSILPARGLRVVQHVSAACRAARFPSVRECAGAAILRHMDDVDVSICKRNAVSGPLHFGIFASIVLIPAGMFSLNYYWVAYIISRTVFIVEVAVFVLLNVCLIAAKSYWLIGLYGFLAIYAIAFRVMRAVVGDSGSGRQDVVEEAAAQGDGIRQIAG
jgi:hypothetical protein